MCVLRTLAAAPFFDRRGRDAAGSCCPPASTMCCSAVRRGRFTGFVICTLRSTPRGARGGQWGRLSALERCVTPVSGRMGVYRCVLDGYGASAARGPVWYRCRARRDVLLHSYAKTRDLAESRAATRRVCTGTLFTVLPFHACRHASNLTLFCCPAVVRNTFQKK